MSTNARDPHNLQRFDRAQESVYDQALAELRNGQKRTHWMWFIFPQMRGLGSSPMAVVYGIGSLNEARAYLNHSVLGSRLLECVEAVLSVQNKSATEIFGSPDDMKLRSSATLFAEISPPDSSFHRVLDKYYSSEPDPKTLSLLRTSNE